MKPSTSARSTQSACIENASTSGVFAGRVRNVTVRASLGDASGPSSASI